jgi:hypothetical protein
MEKCKDYGKAVELCWSRFQDSTCQRAQVQVCEMQPIKVLFRAVQSEKMCFEVLDMRELHK